MLGKRWETPSVHVATLGGGPGAKPLAAGRLASERLPATGYVTLETTRIRALRRHPVVLSKRFGNLRTKSLAFTQLERASQPAGLGGSALGAGPLLARCHQLLGRWSTRVRAAASETALPCTRQAAADEAEGWQVAGRDNGARMAPQALIPEGKRYARVGIRLPSQL